MCERDHAYRFGGYFALCALLRGAVGGKGVFCVWIQYSSKTVPLEPQRALLCSCWLGFE